MSHCHPQHKTSKKNATKGDGWKQSWIPIAAIVLFLAAGFVIVIKPGGGGNNASLTDSVTPGEGKLEITPSGMVDLGSVSMRNGIVTTTYTIRNTGVGSLTIRNLQTSCMCTTAQLEVGGEKSQKFGMGGHGGPSSRGWSMEIPPNQEGTLHVYFDPNAHGPAGVGPIERAVLFTTNDAANSSVELAFKGLVTP
ncbi:MAG: hypothetical protein A2806_02625 [Candidatus Terrybacteria bacterium RIFCSPHIGHO2_01_FULL_48_17]|uniref:DUF1573 domain-containing protein n=1 Tax=Candidatus Terrybacteria bacterium RIFCSPHIGHO2_01_FULL_48_17 TaxID=1802362 RepID=A0A1G2PHY1_9BACT|nr:MAG: hypothetical protein A2806_02625 [Candidatus Terrybacteria bacterium RIFCSPHIGHO2_01_FULL_48_17]OHA52077.1 MAG: hypothetical protein A3A30_04165 [Candidatus Terrybacteria bacterium RIFCSPLOWO2_01_FULL_48_14]